MPARIVAETDVVISLDQKIHHLADRPPADVLAVQLLVVPHDQGRAVVHHERVRDLLALPQLLPGDHLVGLDISVGAVMGHADIHLHEAVGPLAPDSCFESRHLCSNFFNEVNIVVFRNYLSTA